MRWKQWAGLALVVLSIAAMYLWETSLREQVVYRNVLVCSRDIEAGDIIGPGDLRTIKFTPGSVLDGALGESGAALIIGKAARQPLRSGQQVLEEYFSVKPLPPEDYASFTIPSEWIFSQSSLNSAEDTVRLYIVKTGEYLGTYVIRVLPGQGRDLEIACSLNDLLIIHRAVEAFGKHSIIIVNEAYK